MTIDLMLQRFGRRRRLWLLACLLLPAACGQGEEGANGFAPDLLRAEAACESRTFEDAAFTVCAYDPARDELRLASRGADGRPLRSLAALEQSLGPDAARVRFAMNAGMYDEEGLPIGLFTAAGTVEKPLNLRRGPGNFHLLPNGVFAVDEEGRPRVITSTEYGKRTGRFRWATQSGPMLVVKGRLHPKIDRDGPSRLVRNGVGVKDGRTAYFVISDTAVSFGRLARFFRDVLGCPDALFLDGTVSSLWDRPAGRQDGYSALGPMVVVLAKGSAPVREE